ncbi:MAG: hypothetical protein WCF44_14645, partial [Candidatus Methylophosphatis roskildensis]
MSGDLNISFASDMPAASVEVVAPDMQVIERVMLDAGRSKTVSVPSEHSFLRVHLPSGQVVTLNDPGNLSRVVSMQTILDQTAAGARATPARSVHESAAPSDECMEDLPSLAEVARYHTRRTRSAPRAPTQADTLPLSSFGSARLLAPDGTSLPGISLGGGREVQWQPNGNPQLPPLALRIERPGAPALQVAIPGDVQRAWARTDLVREQNSLTLSVRLTTSEPAADTILGYLQRGDLYSAETMAAWIDEAEEMLLYKKNDPYAATVGAYLLLRLKRFDNLHDWARNLADRFGFLPDGCVIWAWQLIHQKPSDSGEIRKYFLQAAERGLPIYTEGLRLLLDGLRLLGSEARAAREQVLERAGVVV